MQNQFKWLICTVIVAGTLTFSGAARAQDDGKLDTVFGNNDNGWVTTDFGGEDFGGALAIQVNSKIVVVGSVSAVGEKFGGNFGAARYDATGSLDTSFGSGGMVNRVFFNSSGQRRIVSANAVAIQADGKIVVGGRIDGQLALFRLLSDGSFDSSFGTDGMVQGLIGGNDVVGVAIQGDGRIVTIGSGELTKKWRVTRFLVNGEYDRTFGSNGSVITDVNDFGDGFVPAGIAITVQPDGKIVAVGGLRKRRPIDGVFYPRGIGVVRYLSDGMRDDSFDLDGIKINLAEDGGLTRADSVAIQRDGKIVVGGVAGFIGVGVWVAGNDLAAARFLQDGSLDNSFGVDGVVKVDFGTANYVRQGMIAIEDLGANSDRIILAGWATDGCEADPFCANNEKDFVFVRLQANGMLDPNFPSGGTVRTDFGPDSFARGVALRRDRFWLAGNIGEGVGRDFGLARYVNFGQIGIGQITQYLTTADCADDVTANNTPNLCGAEVSYPDPVLGDPGFVTCLPEAGSFFDVGTTETTCTSIVGDGTQNQQRQATCSLNVTVFDVEPPNVQCPSVSVPTAEGQCSATPAIPVSAGDNCDVTPPVIAPPSGSEFALGTTPYTASVTDALGNSSMCSSAVTVSDETPPSIQCNTEGVGVRPGMPVSFQATATDSCTIASVAVTSYDCWAFNPAGRRVDKTDECSVLVSGADVNIVEPSGVGTIIGWTVEATDGSGNVETASCQVESVNPSAL